MIADVFLPSLRFPPLMVLPFRSRLVRGLPDPDALFPLFSLVFCFLFRHAFIRSGIPPKWVCQVCTFLETFSLPNFVTSPQVHLSLPPKSRTFCLSVLLPLFVVTEDELVSGYLPCKSAVASRSGCFSPFQSPMGLVRPCYHAWWCIAGFRPSCALGV